MKNVIYKTTTGEKTVLGTRKKDEYGILIRNRFAWKKLRGLTTVVLDKTGTITEGRLEVSHICHLVRRSDDKLLQIAASAEVNAGHPFGKAIVEAAKEKQLELLDVTQSTELPEYGAIAVVEDKTVLVGNEKVMKDRNIVEKESMEIARGFVLEGKTPLFLAIDGKVAGIICVEDVIRKNSRQAVEQLTQMGIEVVMLTGDNESTAKEIARQVGIENVFHDVPPRAKADQIKTLIEQGKKVAMVGDGINDAIALAVADVGFAMGEATEEALESADIVLTENDLMGVIDAIQLSRKNSLRCVLTNRFHREKLIK